MYDDYAISDELFHWQSQSTTPSTSPTGLRYINHAKSFHTILLFVREDSSRNGLTITVHFPWPSRLRQPPGKQANEHHLAIALQATGKVGSQHPAVGE